MSSTISLSPLTRIEGHLAIHTETEPVESPPGAVRVTHARCEGEMYRGFEQILRGRDPLDAQQITQRICGVCPISHGLASIRAQEMAYGIRIAGNGRLLQNLILAADYLHSHLLHFYHLAALDFVDVTAILSYTGSDRSLRAVKNWVEAAIARQDSFPAAPLLPRYEAEYAKSHDRNVALLAHYIEALDLRRVCHEMAAVFGARLPHSTAIVPGGVTQVPTEDCVVSYAARLRRVRDFIESVYLPDLLEVAAEFPQYLDIGNSGNGYLCYGVFENTDQGERMFAPGVLLDGTFEPLDPRHIGEDVSSARYAAGAPRAPAEGETHPEPQRAGAYSWIKAPRYKGRPMEVGALARVLVNYHHPSVSWVRQEVDEFLAAHSLPAEKLGSVLGRHVARGLEARWIARQALRWLDEIKVDQPAAVDFELPRTGSGYGLLEAPRGALGHWLTLDDYRVLNYQCVVPTTWNCSPRDAQGTPGPVESALAGTLVCNPDQPIEIGRIVRSFDPCIACAVH